MIKEALWLDEMGLVIIGQGSSKSTFGSVLTDRGKDLLRQIGAEEFQLWPSQTTVLLPSIVEPSLHLQQKHT